MGGASTFPAPVPANDLDEEFWAHCGQRRLCFQRCQDCGTWRHLPRHMCNRCGSLRWEWAASSGRGRIFSWTITHKALFPGFADQVPYATVIVELEEGVRLVTAVRDLALANIRLDLPVEVEFEPRGDALVPVFRPAGAPP